jgi:hypothetical protein
MIEQGIIEPNSRSHMSRHINNDAHMSSLPAFGQPRSSRRASRRLGFCTVHAASDRPDS